MTGDASEHPEPVVVATSRDRGEAEVTKAHLAANGIEAFILDVVEGGTLPVESEAAVAVLVEAKDADAARAVLAGTRPPDLPPPRVLCRPREPRRSRSLGDRKGVHVWAVASSMLWRSR